MLVLSRIVVATDFSPTSMIALRHALGIARRYHASVCLLHVVDPSIYGWVGPDGTSADLDAALRDCEALEATLRHEGMLDGLSFSFAVNVGAVWESIKDTANGKPADLLVLGTHGRSGVSKLALGSVAELAFKDVPCPVMTVGPLVRQSKALGAAPRHFLVPTDISLESIDALLYGTSLAQATIGDVSRCCTWRIPSQVPMGAPVLKLASASFCNSTQCPKKWSASWSNMAHRQRSSFGLPISTKWTLSSWDYVPGRRTDRQCGIALTKSSHAPHARCSA